MAPSKHCSDSTHILYILENRNYIEQTCMCMLPAFPISADTLTTLGRGDSRKSLVLQQQIHWETGKEHPPFGTVDTGQIIFFTIKDAK